MCPKCGQKCPCEIGNVGAANPYANAAAQANARLNASLSDPSLQYANVWTGRALRGADKIDDWVSDPKPKWVRLEDLEPDLRAKLEKILEGAD